MLPRTITASARSSIRRACSLAPAKPPLPPDVEMKVMVRRRRPSAATRASSSSAAVADSSALEPGRAASRWATTTIGGPGIPGRVATTSTRSRLPSIVSPWKWCSSTVPGTDSRSWRATKAATRASPALPGRRSGKAWASWPSVCCARKPSKPSGLSVVPIARGRSWRENAATSSASSTGTNATRYRRGSSTTYSVSHPMAERAPRILLADDEQSIQTLLSFPLRKDGYEVTTAADGREALARFNEGRYDLVVLDVMMPRMDGLEVCRRIRARNTVPIIMLTAKTEEIDKVLGLELGADDYITKPFSLREFRSRVRAALRRAGMQTPSADPDADEQPLAVHELEMDPAKRAVRVRGGAVELTFVE